MRKAVLVGFVVSGFLQACAADTVKPIQVTQVKSASSGLMLELSLQDLVDMSGWVITGTVTGQESRWDAGHTSINTMVNMDVSEWVKGTPFSTGPQSEDGSVVISVPGGRVGSAAQEVEDMPVFSNGQQALVFLRSSREGNIEVSGGFQGKYTIRDGNAVPALSSRGSVPLDVLIVRIRAIADK